MNWDRDYRYTTASVATRLSDTYPSGAARLWTCDMIYRAFAGSLRCPLLRGDEERCDRCGVYPPCRYQSQVPLAARTAEAHTPHNDSHHDQTPGANPAHALVSFVSRTAQRRALLRSACWPPSSVPCGRRPNADPPRVSLRCSPGAVHATPGLRLCASLGCARSADGCTRGSILVSRLHLACLKYTTDGVFA